MNNEPEKKNFIQKTYAFSQSNVGIGILFFSCVVWFYSFGNSFIDNLLEAIGIVLGGFLATYIVVFVLSRKFKWSSRQQIVHTLLLLFLIPFIQKNHTLGILQNIVFILFLIAAIVLITIDFFKWIFKK